MRSFQDPEGRHWDVTVGRESWGAFYVLFVPRVAEDAILQAPLAVASAEEAGKLLDSLDDEGLTKYLSEAEPKPLS